MEEQQYNEAYYNRIGGGAYHESASMRNLMGRVAEMLIRLFSPRTVLDAGCATGLLVEALRDRGVAAYGVDLSEYAISQVREDLRSFCAVGDLTQSLPAELPRHYDLVVTIEVLEHLYEADGKTAVSNLCGLADTVVFSSTPSDFSDPTHVNVQQREYWVNLFTQQGFYDDLEVDLTALTQQALCFRRGADDGHLVERYERAIRQMKTRLPKTDQIAKLYFDTGSGYSETERETVALNGSSAFTWSGPLPAGCRAVRYDPVEGCGCLVSDLKILGPGGVLASTRHNGAAIGVSLSFSTRDPQIEVAAPAGAPFDFLSISANVVFFNIYALSDLACGIDRMLSQSAAALAERKTLGESLTAAKTESGALAERLNAAETENVSLTERLTVAETAKATLQEQLTDAEQERTELETALAEAQETSAVRWKEIQDYSNLVAYERGEAARVSAALAAMQRSHIWRATKPLRVVLDGVKRCLRPFAKVFRSLQQNGLRITLRKIGGRLSGKPVPAGPQIASAVPGAPAGQSALVPITGNPVDAIASVVVDEPVRRLNVVTDTIDAGSLLGGVATALLAATEFANRYGYELRIITRNTDVNPLNYENIMRISGIAPAKSISYYSDYERHTKPVDFKLELTEGDVFFATSWWSAQAIMKTTLRPRFFYIIQEVETFFYNYGDERMLCEQTMRSDNIDFIVNSGYLFHYFQTEFPHIPENGMYFEPAFPKDLYRPGSFAPKRKYRLFFYARPHNPRNLFATGVKMLDEAIRRGILDTSVWTICCVGQDVPEIRFCDGSTTENLGQMKWEDYAKFLADVDLGLCLMYTPHPSYPPYDVACSGGVVLSNTMCNKTSFPQCKNVILGDLESETFLNSFAQAAALAQDMKQRKENFENSTILRDWSAALEETVRNMGRCTGDV